MKPPLRRAADLGQSVWQDDLSRARFAELAGLVRDGVCGITANPTTFEKAFAGGAAEYDAGLHALVERGVHDPKELYERLAIEDVQRAADLLHGAYEDSDGRDGLVSFEVAPALAHDAAGTVEEAKRLHRAIGRANTMIKVPGTDEGFEAIEELTSLGININVTLLFGIDAYRASADAYMSGLERLVEAGGDPHRVSSVASFFLSRIDAAVGKPAAIPNAKLAYVAYQELIGSGRWRTLAAWGARSQRLLWASTGVKDPALPKLHYVEALIGRDTVDTMPRETLLEFRERGRVAETLTRDVDDARRRMEALDVDFPAVTRQLVEQGIAKFGDSYDQLLRSIAVRARD